MIAEPPLLAGSVNTITAWAFPEIAFTPVGGLGTVAIAPPAPLMFTVVTGFAKSLLETLRLAERAPEAPGVNVTLMVQLEVGARTVALVQDPPVEKSAAFAPVTEIAVRERFALPAFVIVTT